MDKAPPQLLGAARGLPSAAEAILRCQAALLARPRLAEAAAALATELAQLLQCRRATIGLLEGERLRIVGSSHAAAGQACSVPIVAGDQVVGALVLEREPNPRFLAAEIALCEDACSFAGPVLAMQRRQELPWHRRLRDRLAAQLDAPGRRRLAWTAGLLALAVALALPLPWRVSAPARLEGSVQRAVVGW